MSPFNQIENLQVAKACRFFYFLVASTIGLGNLHISYYLRYPQKRNNQNHAISNTGCSAQKGT